MENEAINLPPRYCDSEEAGGGAGPAYRVPPAQANLRIEVLTDAVGLFVNNG
ncbi:hypothetical protein J6590_050065 [Homalodisca vitripennis]|nr:hypothetical protein J6590_050065 [Homalodisca vitripennis]